MKKIVALFTAALLFLTGCSTVLAEYKLPSTDTQPTTESPLPSAEQERTYNTYPVDQDLDAVFGSADHEIFFLENDRRAQYYDLSVNKEQVYCTRPGCTHLDKDCPAYYGGAVWGTNYTVNGEYVYAAPLAEDSGSFSLLAMNILTGEKETLLSRTAPEGHYYEPPTLIFTGSSLIVKYFDIYLQDHYENGDQVVDELSQVTHIERFDLSTGEVRELFSKESPSYGGRVLGTSGAILDAGDRYALFMSGVDFVEPPTSRSDFLKDGGTEAEYGEYVSSLEETGGDYYLWDLESGEKTFLYSYDEDLTDSSFAYSDDHTVCFARGNAVWRLDLKDGTTTELFTTEAPVVMTEQWDGRVFYNTEKDGVWEWFWYELATGETHQFQKGVYNCIFSIYAETPNYFVGLVEGGDCAFYVLSKQDYYNENYAAAQSIGSMSIKG